MKRDAPPRQVKFMRGGHNLSVFEIRLPEAGQAPDFWVFLEQPPIRELTLLVRGKTARRLEGLEPITQSEDPPDAEKMYREKDRPQFHFTSRRGWLNDPNGLVWHQGKYHLFYQHNPYGWEWGNMHWGHAVSPDLLHWTELPQAISPREFGDWAFSGQRGGRIASVSGREIGLSPRSPAPGAASASRITSPSAASWTFDEYAKNPVVKHQGRDPRLLWHKPTNRWVMAVYDEFDRQAMDRVPFIARPEALDVREPDRGLLRVPGPVRAARSGKPGDSRWVLYAADGAYVLGQFDGKKFTPDSKQKAASLVRQFLRRPDLQRHARRPPHSDRLGQRNRVSRHAVQPADDDPVRVDAALDRRRHPDVCPSGCRAGVASRAEARVERSGCQPRPRIRSAGITRRSFRDSCRRRGGL